MAKAKIPIIDREKQVTQMNELFPGATLKSIKDDGKGIISLEFETVGVIIFANPLHNQAELKKDLHSLLISKLPEKMVRSEIFEGESDGTIEAYNSAIEDMKAVLAEMFEVHNEK